MVGESEENREERDELVGESVANEGQPMVGESEERMGERETS